METRRPAGTKKFHRKFSGIDTVEIAGLKEPIALVVDDEPLTLMETADIISEAVMKLVANH